MAVVVPAVKKLPFPANVPDVDLGGGQRQRAGCYLFDGDELVAPWHRHAMHEIQYAFEGIAEVESAGSRHVLPPGQAVWIPAGLPHRTKLRGVRFIAVFVEPGMVHGGDDRVGIVAVPP
jgi:mannose-6-phosphate isomerase-like protein (cupin superfamily)